MIINIKKYKDQVSLQKLINMDMLYQNNKIIKVKKLRKYMYKEE